MAVGGLLLPQSVFSDESVVAGNLYLLNLSKTLDPKIMIRAFMRSVNLYDRIGISFQNVGIVDSPPNLGGLDQCVISHDNKSQMRLAPNMRSFGEFGPNPQYFRKEVETPYDDLTIQSNCILIHSNVLASCEQDQNVPLITYQLIAHEIGHAFAQPHIYDNPRRDVKTSSLYVMSAKIQGGDWFHEINKRGGVLNGWGVNGRLPVEMLGMPDFIRFVKENGYDLSIANRIRNSQFAKDIYLDELTAQGFFLSYQR